MATNAHCMECGTRVELTEVGACPNGHPRSALRDVREGQVVAAQAASCAVRPSAVPERSVLPVAKEEVAANLIGKGIVIVPVAIVVIIGLWSGYAGGVAMGMSKAAAWVSSIGSLLSTGAIVWFIVWNKRRKMM